MPNLTDRALRTLAIACGDPAAANELISIINGKAGLNDPNSHTALNTFARMAGSGGTAHATNGSDWALSGGFGSTASVAVAAGSTDSRGKITITSAGTGQGANPTATLTFKDGTWGSAPLGAFVCRGGGSQLSIPVIVSSVSATQLVLQFIGTPVAAETYVIYYGVEG